MTITQIEFYELPAVKACVEAQKSQPFGSLDHRAAEEIKIKIAESYGVSEYVGSMEDYD